MVGFDFGYVESWKLICWYVKGVCQGFGVSSRNLERTVLAREKFCCAFFAFLFIFMTSVCGREHDEVINVEMWLWST
jgi:hypothetical protein